MSKKYNCEYCNYDSINHFNYIQHCKTKKHLKNAKSKNGDLGCSTGDKWCGSPKNTIKINIDPVIKIDKQVGFICEFCNKIMSYKNHKTRHIKTCKEKKKQDDELIKNDIINKLKEEKEAIERENEIISKEKEEITLKLSKEKEIISKEKDDAIKQKIEIEKEYNDHLKKIANKFINDKKSPINILFVINNYGHAYNYEDLMGPKLTKAEIAYIEKFGPTAGCERLIYNRCVKDIELDKRPIHCVDPSRDKFALRTENEWVQDWKGEKILTPAFKHVRKAVDISDPDNMDQEDLLKKTKSLIEMDMYGGKKAIKFIGKQTLLDCKDK